MLFPALSKSSKHCHVISRDESKWGSSSSAIPSWMSDEIWAWCASMGPLPGMKIFFLRSNNLGQSRWSSEEKCCISLKVLSYQFPWIPGGEPKRANISPKILRILTDWMNPPPIKRTSPLHHVDCSSKIQKQQSVNRFKHVLGVTITNVNCENFIWKECEELPNLL